MINQRAIFDIHRLANDGFSVRKIAATLGVDRQTVQKYLDNPMAQAAHGRLKCVRISTIMDTPSLKRAKIDRRHNPKCFEDHFAQPSQQRSSLIGGKILGPIGC